MSLRLVILAAISGALAAPATAAPLEQALAACRALSDTGARLSCYDRLPLADEGRTFTGKGSGVTERFLIEAPQVLSFDTDDAVMVLYLLDENDQVVQNLHRGGAGGGRYLIDRPGTYHVQINATGGWTVRLEDP